MYIFEKHFRLLFHFFLLYIYQFEYFFTNGQKKLISKLYLFKGGSYNFQNLFRIDILLEKTNEKLINILKDIPIFPEVEELNKENDQEDNIKNDMFDTNNKYIIPKK